MQKNKKIGSDLQCVIQDKVHQGVPESVFAAAPELLQALRSMVEISLPERVNVRPHEDCGCFSCRVWGVIDQAQAAIARAEGGNGQ